MRILPASFVLLSLALCGCVTTEAPSTPTTAPASISGNLRIGGMAFEPRECRAGAVQVNDRGNTVVSDVLWLADGDGNQLQLSGTRVEGGTMSAHVTPRGGTSTLHSCAIGSLSFSGNQGRATVQCGTVVADVTFAGCNALTLM